MRLVPNLVCGLSALLALPAWAGWHYREEAVMGTRVTVELWADDDAVGRHRHGGHLRAPRTHPA